MLTKSVRLNHKYQLPLGMDQAGQDIVEIIESSTFEGSNLVLLF